MDYIAVAALSFVVGGLVSCHLRRWRRLRGYLSGHDKLKWFLPDCCLDDAKPAEQGRSGEKSGGQEEGHAEQEDGTAGGIDKEFVRLGHLYFLRGDIARGELLAVCQKCYPGKVVRMSPITGGATYWTGGSATSLHEFVCPSCGISVNARGIKEKMLEAAILDLNKAHES